MELLLTGFLIGCAFGAILFLGGATSYRKILGTLLLKDMTIIKLMLTAIGVVAGGGIFGIGWAISGYCPGTCLVGASEGKLDALFTLLGALFGAFVFAMAFPILDAWLLQNANFGKITLEEVIGVSGIYLAMAFSMTLLFLAFFVLKDRYE